MAKFKDSLEAITSNIHLWDINHTQTSIKDCKTIVYYPLASIENSDSIDFRIPGHPNLMLDYIDVMTDFKITPEIDPAARAQASVVSNLANSLWKNVQVSIGGVNLLQSFDHAYNIITWFDIALNSNPDREDVLLLKECFLMDNATNKADSESVVIYDTDVVPAAGENPEVPALVAPNSSAAKRIARVHSHATLIAELHCPIFKQDKLLPANLPINVKLVKCPEGFPMLCASTVLNHIELDKVQLRVHYKELPEHAFTAVETRLLKEPARYEVDNQLVTFHAIPAGRQSVTFNNLFNGPLPKFFICGVNHRSAYANSKDKNPYTFLHMRKIQAFINGEEYFAAAVDNHCTMVDAFQEALGLKTKGACLISPLNYDIHHVMPFTLTADKSIRTHLNLMKTGNVRLEVDLTNVSIEGLILVVYALYDRVIEIDTNRQVNII